MSSEEEVVDYLQTEDSDYEDTIEDDLETADITEEEETSIVIFPDEETDTHISTNFLQIHTDPYMTKYEYAKVLALRVQQLDNNAPPTVEPSDFENNQYPSNTKLIAIMEIKKGKMPFIIRRTFYNGDYVDIPVNKLRVRLR